MANCVVVEECYNNYRGLIMGEVRPRIAKPANSNREIFDEEGIRQTRLFFWMLELTLLILYGWSLYNMPALRAPGKLILFSSLMLAHGILHWVSPMLFFQPKWVLPYFAVQAIIAFALNEMSGETGLLFALYLALVGEAVGSIQRRSILAVVLAILLVLSAISFGVTLSWGAISSWLLTVLPMGLFVAIYVSLFTRQARAKEEAQGLLRELETTHHRLAEYAAQVESLTRANERQRMARELHDTLAQGLAGLILQLEAADAHASSGRSEKVREIIQQAMSRARTTLADARRAIDDLRHEEGGQADLSTAVQDELKRFSRSTGIPYDLDLEKLPLLPEVYGEHVRRVLSESLTNIVRHAQATRAWVRLNGTPEAVELIVGDDGIGFEPQDSFSTTGHYGLIGMRERARLAGGTLSIDSTPGKGTMVRLLIPLHGGINQDER